MIVQPGFDEGTNILAGSKIQKSSNSDEVPNVNTQSETVEYHDH